MPLTIVSAPDQHEVLVLEGKTSANMVHEIAEAFIQGAQMTPLKLKARKIFGRWTFNRYAIDFTGKIAARVTFSVLVKPDTLNYRRGVIAIASKHAASFELRFLETEVVEHGGFGGQRDRPYCVS